MKFFENYEDWAEEYIKTLIRFFEYTPEQAGSIVYAEKLGKLRDDYPEYEKRFDADYK